MAKYDCTKTQDFFHEANRLSDWCDERSTTECKNCMMKLCAENTCVIGILNGVYEAPKNYDLVIQRVQNWSDSHPEKRELTENERNILKAFKTLGFAYIAADKNGCVCTYIHKPRKGERGWYNTSGDYEAAAVCKTGKFFGDILSYDDEEPAEIEELLKGVEE